MAVPGVSLAIGQFYGLRATWGLGDTVSTGHAEVMALPSLLRRPLRSTSPEANSTHDAVSLAPGLLLATGVAVAAWWLASFGTISTLTVAVIVGMMLGNSPVGLERFRPGLHYAGKSLLRVGVVLLGMRLSVAQVGELGLPVIAVIAATVAATFFGTQALGRRLGVSGPLSLLIATGYSICGASAIAAMEPTSDAEEEEVAAAIGLVTLAGTIAMFAIPALGSWLALNDEQFAIWAGASIHDVAQVVAAGATRGPEVLAAAVVVKLTRVLLLAPLVAGVSARRQRQSPTGTATTPLIPGFVLGFLLLLAMRSTGLVPDLVVDTVAAAERMIFAIALVGLGAGVQLSRLRKLGGAPLLLGAIAAVLVGGVSLGAVLIAT